MIRNVMWWFVVALTVLFVGLKLTDQIDWSWWLVWSPVLSILVVINQIYALVGFIAAMMELSEEKARKRRRSTLAETRRDMGWRR